MHHTAGADTGFSKRTVYRSDPQYEKRICIRPQGGGGGGGDRTLPALYPPPYSIYVLNGEGDLALERVGGER